MITKSTDNLKILILGGDGMLGHTVYKYLSLYFQTFATSRNKLNDNKLISFDAEKDTPKKIFSLHKKFDYIINCIGILPHSKNTENMEFINSTLPHLLARESQKHGSYFIHISTDAVYSDTENIVDESDKPRPDTYYGKTKYNGEINGENTMIIRTSIIGLDPTHKKGLLEWAKNEETITGFTNQNWSGCTSLQLAQLIKNIILNNSLPQLFTTSHVFHFVPIRDISKYNLLKEFIITLKNNKKIVPSEGRKITRSLHSRYSQLLPQKNITHELGIAFKELIAFEK